MSYFAARLPIVQAVQWERHGDHPQVFRHSDSDGYQRGDWMNVILVNGSRVEVKPGDWIVTDDHGRVFPMKPRDFERAYEPIENSEAAT